MKSKSIFCYSFVLLALVLALGYQASFAQSTAVAGEAEEPLALKPEVESFQPIQVYAHLFGGMGMSFLTAEDVESIIGDDFGIGIGLPTWSYGIRGGFRNILQVEYNFGIASHDFNNNSIIEDIPNEVIEMDYETTDIQFKFNPFFWKAPGVKNGKTKAIFLIYGFGDVEWRDTNDDGFEGTSTILGIEYSRFSKNLSWSVSFKHYGIEFDETTVFNIPFEHSTEASDYILEFKVGFGVGA